MLELQGIPRGSTGLNLDKFKSAGILGDLACCSDRCGEKTRINERAQANEGTASLEIEMVVVVSKLSIRVTLQDKAQACNGRMKISISANGITQMASWLGFFIYLYYPPLRY